MGKEKIKPTKPALKPTITMDIVTTFNLDSIKDEDLKARLTEKLKDANPLHTRGMVKIFYKGKNRNWTYINDEVAEMLVKSLPNVPIVGEFWEVKQDFGTHGGAWRSNADGHIEYELTTIPYGVVPADTEVWYETQIDADNVERTYLCAEVLLWKHRYEKELDILLKENRPHSMELAQKTTYGDWEYDEENGDYLYHYKAATLSALCILGKDIEPCFEGASFVTFSLNNSAWTEFKKEYSQMLTEFENKNIVDSEILEKRLEEFAASIQNQPPITTPEPQVVPPVKVGRPDGLKVFTQNFNIIKGGNTNMDPMKLQFADNQDIRAILFRAMNPVNTETEVYELKYVVAEVKDNVAIVFRYEDNTFCTVKFEISGEEIKLETPVAVSPLFQTEAEATEYKASISKYATVKADLIKAQGEITALETKMKDHQLSTEDYTAIKTKSDQYDLILPDYTKLKAELTEKERAAKSKVIETFAYLGDEELKVYKEKIDEFSLEDLDTKLSAIAFKKGLQPPPTSHTQDAGSPAPLQFEMSQPGLNGGSNALEAAILATQKRLNS